MSCQRLSVLPPLVLQVLQTLTSVACKYSAATTLHFNAVRCICALIKSAPGVFDEVMAKSVRKDIILESGGVSGSDSGGKIPGSRRASMLLPHPGGPLRSR